MTTVLVTLRFLLNNWHQRLEELLCVVIKISECLCGKNVLYFSQISPKFHLYCSLVLLLTSKCLCISLKNKLKIDCVASNTHQTRKQSSFSAYLIQYRNLFSVCLFLTPREAFSGVSQGPASLLFKTKPNQINFPCSH